MQNMININIMIYKLLVLGDEEQGIAIVKAEIMKEFALDVLKGMGMLNDEKNKSE